MARTISLSFGKDGKADGPEPATRPRSPTPQPEAGPSRSRSRLSSASSLMSHDTKESSPAHSPPAETQFRSQGQDSDDQLWEADCILDERGPVATGQYLVQWVGHDPATGERWEPTWERREDVTPLLAKEWKDKKRADPGVVGVEGKKLEAEGKSKNEAAKKEKKRKRDEKASQARKKAKARVAPRGGEAGTTRSTSVQIPDGEGDAVPKRQRRRLEVVVPRRSRESADLNVDKSSRPEEPEDGSTREYDHVHAIDPVPRHDLPEAISQLFKSRDSSPPLTIIPSERAPSAHRKSAVVSTLSAEPNENDTESSPVEKQNGTGPPTTHIPKRVRIEPSMQQDRMTSAMKMKLRVAEKTKELEDKAKAKATDAETEIGDRQEDPATSGGSTSGKAHKSIIKTLAPVPVPSPSQFKALLPSSRVDSSPSTASSTTGMSSSQLDLIQQFLSPARGSQIVNAEGRLALDRAGAEVGVSLSAAKIVRRVLDGDEVLAVAEDSDEVETQAEGTSGQPAEEFSDNDERDVFMADVVAVDEILTPVEASPVSARKAAESAAKSKLLSAVLFPESEIRPTTEAIDEGVAPHNQAAPTATLRSETSTTPKLKSVDKRLEDTDAASSRSPAGPSMLPQSSQKPASSLTFGLGQSTTLGLSARSKAETRTRDASRSPLSTWSLRPTELPVKTPAEYEEQIAALHLLVSKLQTEKISLSSSASTSLPSNRQASAPGSPVPSTTVTLAQRPVIGASNPTVDNSAQTLTVPAIESAAATVQTEPEPATALAPALAAVSGFTQAELDEKLAEKDVVTKKWRIRAKKAEADNTQFKEDIQFFREQYDSASNSAVAEVVKSKALSDQLEILQGQLKHGLKQREVHTAAIRAQFEREIAKLTGTNKILLDQSRRTDDAVRAKAARFPRLELEFERAQLLLKRAERKIEDLTDRNDELLSQVEVLRAMQMGVLVEGADDPEDEDYSYQSESGSERRSPEESGRVAGAEAEAEDPLTASQLMPDTQDLGPQSHITNNSLGQGASQGVGIERRGQAFASPWVGGVFLADESAVKEHLMQEVDSAFM